MVWDPEGAHLLEKFELLIVDPPTSTSPSLPWAHRAIENEKELDVQCEKAADAIESGLFDALKRGLVRH